MSTDILTRWQEAGLLELDLPSGFRVRLRPVSPAQLITGGLLPYELVGALVEASERGARPSDDIVGKATLEYVGKERELAARSVRAIWNGQAWEPIVIDPARFGDGTFPPDDVEAIVESAMGQIRSSAEREGVGAEALATFPADGPGADGRADGGAVRPAAVPARRDRRSAARAAAGRGDGAPAGAG